MKIQNNITAMFAHRQLSITNLKLEKSLERLSSGYRINRAADDAAGLAVSEKFRTQVGGLKQAAKNIMDGISLIQTAEGGLQEIHLILQRMRTLAVQAANDTYTSGDRKLIQVELGQLYNEINRMQTTVVFNTKQLLTGEYAVGAGSIRIQTGANAGQTLALNIGSMSSTGLGLSRHSGVFLSHGAAESAISILTTAINTVSAARADLGAKQNRLQHTYNFVRISIENQAASESRIRDTDMASEMTEFTKRQILVQAGNAMLAQANIRPSNLLALLQ